MHELSLSLALVAQVESAARAERASRVLSLRLAIGAISGVERSALEFAWPLAAEGTLASGATLVVEEVPLGIRCRACGKESNPELVLIRCAHCGGAEVDIVAGREFVLRSLEVE